METFDLSIGTPVYHCAKSLFSRSRTSIETLWVIKHEGDWISLGYANHPKAFKCNYRSMRDVWAIYAATPEEAVEKARKRALHSAKLVDKKIAKLREEKAGFKEYAQNLHIDDCELIEKEYSVLDDLW